MKDASCSTCAFLSPCQIKCFNPHYVLMSDDNIIPIDPDSFCCIYYRDDESVYLDTSIIIERNLQSSASIYMAKPN